MWPSGFLRHTRLCGEMSIYENFPSPTSYYRSRFLYLIILDVILCDDSVVELHVFLFVYVWVTKSSLSDIFAKSLSRLHISYFVTSWTVLYLIVRVLNRQVSAFQVFLLVPMPIVNHLIKPLDFNSPILVLVHISVPKYHQWHYYSACLLNYVLYHIE